MCLLATGNGVDIRFCGKPKEDMAKTRAALWPTYNVAISARLGIHKTVGELFCTVFDENKTARNGVMEK